MAAFINIGIALNEVINVGIALNKVISSMEAQIEDQTQVPVFLMKDLKKLYQEKLSYIEEPPNFIDNVHITRLKKEISKKIPGLCKQKMENCQCFLLMVKMDEHCLRPQRIL